MLNLLALNFFGFEVTQKAADKRLIVMLKVILCEFNQIE
jgi:hypothetical protein